MCECDASYDVLQSLDETERGHNSHLPLKEEVVEDPYHCRQLTSSPDAPSPEGMLMDVGETIKQETEPLDAESSSAAAAPELELDIIVNNVVCNFSVRCHLNLRHIAMTGRNVEFHKEMAVSGVSINH